MVKLGTGQVYVNKARVTYDLYKAGSAEKHKASDDITLKTELLKALNLPDSLKEHQKQGVVRVKINQGHGYLVYKLNSVGTNSATIFHYHWNYHLDLPLSVT